MKIRCFLGHDWFYYVEFNAFDGERRICRRCGKIESTYMNPDMGYGYDPCGYASETQKEEILNPQSQIKKYQAEIDRLIKKENERRQYEKILNITSPKIIESSANLSGLKRLLVMKYEQKIRELATKEDTQ